MPPRYAYWTIIVDNQPTAFRSGSQEELMPTFNRLKAKNDTAVMMWFQLGKLWPSRVDAQEFMHARGEMGRKGDERQPARRSFSASRPQGLKTSRESRTAWTPRGEPSTPPPARNADAKLDWKPKGEFVPAPKRADREDWKSKASKPQSPRASEKPEWKPKGSFTPAPRRSAGSDWNSKPSSPSTYAKAPADRQAFKPSRSEDRPRSFKRPDFKPSGDDTRSAKPEWKPKGSFTPAPRRSEASDWRSKASKPQSPRASEKPAWKPKGSFDREKKSDWESKASRPQSPRASEKPAWKPKGSFDRERKPDWKSKASKPQSPRASERPEWRQNRDSGGRFSSSESTRAPRGEKLEWKPKGDSTSAPSHPRTPAPEKRKWMPKEEYKKSMGIEAKRDSKWRPGGEHKDPRQKYKDAKKAKWSKFKQNIRARSGGKGKKSS